MTKTTNWMLTALLTMGLSLGFIACSDDDDDDNSGGIPTNEAEYKEAELGWDIITQLTAERKAPEGWQSMTFEPTIGKASETDPYTRVVATNDVAAAAERFGGLVGLPDLISETTTSFTYNQEGMGKLTYQMGSVGGQYLAQVDVDLKQVPHLKKILYQTPEQMGNNSSFAGTAWYRFGDVVKDQKGYYWICVRPAFGPEGKEDSHWMCLSQNLPDENIKAYKTSTGVQNYLPTGLGKSTEHMQNAAEMFYAMTHPDDWFQTVRGGTGASKPKMFNDFSQDKIRYHNAYFWQRVCMGWEENDLFRRVLGISKAALSNDDADWHMLYSGYSWWFSTSWDCNLYEATFKKGEGKKANRHDVTYSKPTKDMHQIVLDAKNGGKVGCVSGEFFDEDHKIRWYARYKKGSELGGGMYGTQTPISGCTDVYVYNKYFYSDTPSRMYNLNDDPEVTTEKMVKNEYYDGVPYYRIGDVVKDEDGALWFCIQPSGASTTMAQFIKEEGLDALKETYKLALDQYSWFISLTPKSKDGELLFYDCGKYYSNLPTRDQARIISYYIGTILWDGVMGKKGKGSELGQCYTNILDYAHVDLLKVVARRDSLYSALTDKANHICNIFINIAYSENGQNEQPYMRHIYDGCALDLDKDLNPKPGSRSVKYWQQDYYTAEGYSKRMILSDLESDEMVRRYAYDKWVTLPWWTTGNSGPNQGDGISTDIYPHEQIRSTTYSSVTPDKYLWDNAKTDYAHPEYKSMYNEPIIMCRVMKVKDRGQKAIVTTNGKRLTDEYLVPFGGDRRENGIFPLYCSGLISLYNYNGVEYISMKDNIFLLGEK